jgi:hypothetical protein
VRHLQGRFVSTSQGGAPFLDDRGSYTVQVDSGEIAIGMASLNALLNEHVLGHGRSNVRNLEITVDEGRLEQKPRCARGSLFRSRPGARCQQHPTAESAFTPSRYKVSEFHSNRS